MTNSSAIRFFPDWYGSVHPSPGPGVIEIKLRCVDEIVAGLGGADAAELVRALLRADTGPSRETRTRLAERFAKIDTSFPARDNTNLLDVMLAGCVAKAIDAGESAGTVAALALSTMTFDGRGRDVYPPELSHAARDYLSSEGARLRVAAHEPLSNPPTPGDSGLEPPEIELGPIAPNHWETVSNNQAALLKAINDSFVTLSTAVQGVRADIAALADAFGPRQRDPAVAALQEETQILWWLFGEHSEAVDQSFAGMQLPGACLVLGAEFAQLTRFIPGHPRAEALLARAVSRCEGNQLPLSLVQVVSGAPDQWRRLLVEQLKTTEDLLPLHGAVRRSLETTGDAWTEGFSTVTGLSSTFKLTPCEWACAIHDEVLLQRALSDASS